MKTVNFQEKRHSHKSLIDAKEAFLKKLEKALQEENSISGALTKTERLPKGETKQRNRATNIRISFGARQWKNKDGRSFLDHFVYNVNSAHRHNQNAQKIRTLIDHTNQELVDMKRLEEEKEEPEPKSFSSLNIHFRRGVIKPTETVDEPEDYHWEMQMQSACHPTSWSQIGETGDTNIYPRLTSGEVRLSYRDGDFVSNKIKLSTVIKRQAASAKRKQHRFERDDPQFQQKCKGVAGRIKRMLNPSRHIVNANFATRVFQDRVVKLQEHLGQQVDYDEEEKTYGPNKSKSIVIYIAELCETGTTDDDEYMHMIEFIEPTVYLNPRGLHRELKDIYEGKRVSLELPVTVVGTRSARIGQLERNIQQQEKAAKARKEANIAQEKALRKAKLVQAAKERKEANIAQEKATKAVEEAKLVQAQAAKERKEANIAQEKATKAVEEAKLVQEAEKTEKASQEAADELAQKAQEAEEAAKEAKEAKELRLAQAAQQELRLTQEKAYTDAQEAMDVEIENASRSAQLPTNIKGFIKTYETKKIGSKAVNPNWWFKANGNYYYKSNTGKTTIKKTIAKANDAGWYEHVTLAVQSLTDDQIAFVKHVFTTYDVNGDDKISELEMVRAYFEGKTRVKASGGAKIIRENDDDGDGSISEGEFIKWCVISGVFDDKSWKDAAAEFKAPVADEPTQQETFASIVVDKDLPYMIGDATQIRSVIDSSVNKAAWEKGNVVRELTSAIDQDFVGPAQEWLVGAGADGWLSGGNIVNMSENDSVRIFYVPMDTAKEFAVTPRGRANKQYINARAICTIYVEKNTFVRNDGKKGQGNVFVLKDIATSESGAKFLLSSALETMSNDNPDVKSVVTQPFNDENFGTREKSFVSWGFRKIETSVSPAAVSPGLMMLDEDELMSKPGDLSAMIQNMTDDWISSDEELDFAEQSENELSFAASSSLDTDSDMDFAQSSERAGLSGEESSAGSEKGKSSSGMEFAESSAAETDSDMEFAESSDKISSTSGMEFAESSAVDSD